MSCLNLTINITCPGDAGRTTLSTVKKADLKPKYCSEDGHIVPSTDWLKEDPNAKRCSDEGHTTLSIGWSNLDPNNKHLSEAGHSASWIGWLKFITELDETQRRWPHHPLDSLIKHTPKRQMRQRNRPHNPFDCCVETIPERRVPERGWPSHALNNLPWYIFRFQCRNARGTTYHPNWSGRVTET